MTGHAAKLEAIASTKGQDRSMRFSVTKDFGLERSRVVLSFIYGITASAFFCIPSWPGFMSYDSLFAYKESIEGISTAIWPPMQAYTFFISRSLGLGVGGLFFAQTFILFFSAGLIISRFLSGTRAIVVAFALFAALFIYFPTLWGTLAVLWKDVTTTSFAMLGIALWLTATQRKSVLALVAAYAAFSVSIALRYNAFPLTMFVVALAVAIPFGGGGKRYATVTSLALAIACLALAYASTTYRLPDLRQLPSERGFAGVEEFDLMGISACANHNYLPPAMSQNLPITPDQIRQLYDPRHVQLAFQPHPGLPALVEAVPADEIERNWKVAVPKEIGCYLAHRTAVFVQQMGIAPGAVFYPTHGGIDANPYGITLSLPNFAVGWSLGVVAWSAQLVCRPILLYLLALVICVVAFARGTRGRLFMASLLVGAFAYPATLFFVGPAADARYIFPSNVSCALLIVVGLAAIFHRKQAQGGPSWPPEQAATAER